MCSLLLKIRRSGLQAQEMPAIIHFCRLCITVASGRPLVSHVCYNVMEWVMPGLPRMYAVL